MLDARYMLNFYNRNDRAVKNILFHGNWKFILSLISYSLGCFEIFISPMVVSQAMVKNSDGRRSKSKYLANTFCRGFRVRFFRKYRQGS